MMKVLFTGIAFFFLATTGFAQLDTAMVRTIGGERFEEANDMLQVADGGYLVLGSTGSLDGFNSEVYLLKVSRDLEYEWSKRLGSNGLERGQSIIQASDGNFVIAGYTLGQNKAYEVLLIKISAEGDLIWSSTFGGSDWDFGYKLVEHANGGFLVVGETWSIGNGMSDIYLVKASAEGEFEWERTFGGPGEDYGTDIVESQIGDGYILTGAAEVDDGGAGLILQGKAIKVDQQGEITWELTNEESGPSAINGISYQGSDYICSGFTFDLANEVNQMTSQFLTADGSFYPTVIWGSPGNQELVDVIHIPSLQTLLYVGTSDTFGNGGLGVYALRRSDSNIDVLGNRVWGGSEDEVGRGVLVDDENAAIFYGWSESYGLGSADVYLIKILDPLLVPDYIIDQIHTIDENIGVSVDKIKDDLNSGIDAYPNPTRGLVNITSPCQEIYEVAIFNSSGQFVERYNLLHKDKFDLSHLKSGHYTIHFISQDGKMLSSNRIVKN